MSDYRQPPPPDPSQAERRFRRVWFTVGLVLIGVCVLAFAGFLTWAFRPPGPEERAKIAPPRPRREARDFRRERSRPTPPPVDPGPAIPPPTEFKPPEVPMRAQKEQGR